MFILNSDITVEGVRDEKPFKFRWSGVNEVRVKRSLHDFSDSCVIKLPSISRVYRKNGGADNGKGVTADLFRAGDGVRVLLGYNGDMRVEFEGFIKTMGLGMPLVIECEGYVRQLRLNIHLDGHLDSVTAKELLLMAVGKMDIKKKKIAEPLTDIDVVCPIDMEMADLKFTNADGVSCLNKLKELSAGVLTIFFIDAKTLWCGLTYTPYTNNNDPFGLGDVKYRLGYNCIKDNGLRERVPVEEVQVMINSVLPTGQKIETKSQANYAKRKEKHVINNVTSQHTLTSFADEKQLQMNYTGYEGNINAFLQPFCGPGYQALIKDNRYPDKDGVYMVESTDVHFSVGGGRRNVEIGPMIGFRSR
jgi:hypothetical protein